MRFCTVTPVPRLIVSTAPPALAKVAVSPVPGSGVADQLVAVAQMASVVPFQVADAAVADWPNDMTMAVASSAVRRNGLDLFFISGLRFWMS